MTRYMFSIEANLKTNLDRQMKIYHIGSTDIKDAIRQVEMIWSTDNEFDLIVTSATLDYKIDEVQHDS